MHNGFFRSGKTDNIAMSNPVDGEHFATGTIQPTSDRNLEQMQDLQKNIIILNTESDKDSNEFQNEEAYDTNSQVNKLKTQMPKDYTGYSSKRLLFSRENRRFKKDGDSKGSLDDKAQDPKTSCSPQSRDEAKNKLNYQSMISNNSSIKPTNKNTQGIISPRNVTILPGDFNIIPNTQIFYPKFS